MLETISKRDPLSKARKLENLRRRQDALRARIAKIEAREKLAARKADIRLKVIVGGAVLADVECNPEARAMVAGLLDRFVAGSRDRAFLKVRKWL